jgi:quinol monooxygenase YgiN
MEETPMDTDHVTVVYKWTAHPGRLDELAQLYRDVTDAMHRNEPGAESVHVYVSEADNSLYVRDEFSDAGAVGFHLQSTAADHFPQLLEIATPGPFFFMGEVPADMKRATEQMQLGAQFSTHSAGFDRST